MAFAELHLENPRTGQLAKAPVGFSWTTFFFGAFPALFRGDFKWAVIMVVAALITFGISQIVFWFIYNRLYVQDLINAGYQVKSHTGEMGAIEGSVKMRLPKASTTAISQGA